MPPRIAIIILGGQGTAVAIWLAHNMIAEQDVQCRGFEVATEKIEFTKPTLFIDPANLATEQLKQWLSVFAEDVETKRADLVRRIIGRIQRWENTTPQPRYPGGNCHHIKVQEGHTKFSTGPAEAPTSVESVGKLWLVTISPWASRKKTIEPSNGRGCSDRFFARN